MMLRRLLLIASLSIPLCGQSPKASPAFEVASVKVAKPDELPRTVHGRGRFSGGPGTSDPGQFAVLGVSLKYLVRYAYNFAHLADILSRNLKAPVVDRTGLQGLFEFRLHFEQEGLPSPPADAAPAPTMFAALEDQLGLKVEQHKQSINVFVVTKADKIPTPD
jgi:hypothetical protein